MPSYSMITRVKLFCSLTILLSTVGSCGGSESQSVDAPTYQAIPRDIAGIHLGETYLTTPGDRVVDSEVARLLGLGLPEEAVVIRVLRPSLSGPLPDPNTAIFLSDGIISAVAYVPPETAHGDLVSQMRRRLGPETLATSDGLVWSDDVVEFSALRYREGCKAVLRLINTHPGPGQR